MNVRQTIELAFEDVAYPAGTNLIDCPCPICRQTDDYFRGRRWQVHTIEGLRKHQRALSSFTPEAFQYFLPAFMLSTLDAWSDADLIPFLITKQFLPPRSDEDPRRQEHHAKRMALFTSAQREAIIAYLRAYEASGTALVPADVRNAIAYLTDSRFAKP